MQQRITLTLESCEIAALIADAQANLRHPREHLRYILRRDLERRGLLLGGGMVDDQAVVDEAHHEQ